MEIRILNQRYGKMILPRYGINLIEGNANLLFTSLILTNAISKIQMHYIYDIHKK